LRQCTDLGPVRRQECRGAAAGGGVATWPPLGDPVGAVVGAPDRVVGGAVVGAGRPVEECAAEVGAGLGLVAPAVAVGDGPVEGADVGRVVGVLLGVVPGEGGEVGELVAPLPPGALVGTDDPVVPPAGPEEGFVTGAFPVPCTTTVEPPGSNRTWACHAVAGAEAWSTTIVTLCRAPGWTTPEELLRRR
jgi:hypothetical protein